MIVMTVTFNREEAGEVAEALHAMLTFEVLKDGRKSGFGSITLSGWDHAVCHVLYREIPDA